MTTGTLAMVECSLGGPEFRYKTEYPRQGGPLKATARQEETVERDPTTTLEARSAAGKKAAAAREARGIPHFVRKIEI